MYVIYVLSNLKNLVYPSCSLTDLRQKIEKDTKKKITPETLGTKCWKRLGSKSLTMCNK